MIVTLIGFMGCGKSSIGKTLATELGWDFADSDLLVEDGERMKIPEIFSLCGENGFRKMEYGYISKTVSEYRGKKNLVFSLGGGAPTNAATAELITKETFPIYLKCPVGELICNLIADGTENRPMLAGYDLETRVRSLMDIREPVYTRCARMIVHPSALTPEILAGIGG